MEPFGDGNTEPIFEFTGEVCERRLLKEKHLSLVTKDKNGKILKMVGFYATPEWLAVENGDKVRVQFTLTKNEFRGKVAIEGSLISLERI